LSENTLKTISLSLYMPPKQETFSYDDGNLLSDGQWNYTYDAENRLTQQQTRNTLLALLGATGKGARSQESGAGGQRAESKNQNNPIFSVSFCSNKTEPFNQTMFIHRLHRFSQIQTTQSFICVHP